MFSVTRQCSVRTCNWEFCKPGALMYLDDRRDSFLYIAYSDESTYGRA